MSSRADRLDPATVTPTHRIASACFYLSSIVALTGVLGVLLGSVPDIQDRLGVDPDAYWNDRLRASLILGTLGLSFGVIVNLVGAVFASSKDPGKRSAGRVVLIITVVPHVASVISLLTLTPQDWTHTITHVLNVMLIAVGLSLSRSPRLAQDAAENAPVDLERE